MPGPDRRNVSTLISLTICPLLIMTLCNTGAKTRPNSYLTLKLTPPGLISAAVVGSQRGPNYHPTNGVRVSVPCPFPQEVD